jgi:large subunit ribosomal protein L20
MRSTNNPASRRRRKRVLKRASGAIGGRHRLFQNAKETVRRALAFAFRDRKQKKRVVRSMWIQRINAACRQNGMPYSRLINGLSMAGVKLDRKMLSEIAIHDEAAFKAIIERARKALATSKEKTANPARFSERGFFVVGEIDGMKRVRRIRWGGGGGLGGSLGEWRFRAPKGWRLVLRRGRCSAFRFRSRGW